MIQRPSRLTTAYVWDHPGVPDPPRMTKATLDGRPPASAASTDLEENPYPPCRRGATAAPVSAAR